MHEIRYVKYKTQRIYIVYSWFLLSSELGVNLNEELFHDGTWLMKMFSSQSGADI